MRNLRFTGRLARTALLPTAVALTALLAGCDHTVTIDGDDTGKPLAALDLSGPPPHAVALLGPDTVRIHTGAKLAIHVEGDGADLRFTLADGTLGIHRKGRLFSAGGGAIIDVTMPVPDSLAMAGSGKITADALVGKASVSIGGSGDISTPMVAADSLEVNIAGSGSYAAGGHVRTLSLNLAGSGDAPMPGLKADKATVSIAGSGTAGFASDGPVSATILGSGAVHVGGKAQCTVTAMGSGKMTCDAGVKLGGDSDDADSADPDDKD